MKLSPNPTPALVAALYCAVTSLVAQSPAPAVDAATLAKYDKNHNGVLDPDERAAMEIDNTVQLSPFEVRTDKDIGYQAVDAGTGGRVDLPFRQMASAMSAMTKEFMDDWSITDMRDSFRYAMSVDAGNFTQNQTPYGDFEFNFRGVGSSGNYPAQNGFLSYRVADSYNQERFEFSMGPNSIMFGDGQIGGLAGSTAKVPRFNRDAYSGSARWDSWGGWRFTGDFNKIVTKKFAVRLDTLYQKNTYGAIWRNDNRSNDRGMDVSATYAFTPDTLITVDADFDHRRNLNLGTTYSDQIGYYTPGYTYDRLNPNLPASQALAGITPVSTNAQNWTIIPSQPQLGLVNTGGSQYFRSTGPGFAIQPNGRSDLPGIASVAKLPSGKEFNLGPNNSWSRFKQQTYTVNLDHRFSDKVSGRVQFYAQNNDRHNRGGFTTSVQYDINRFLPNGQPNPKLGMLYGEESPSRGYQENYVYEWRGLITYRTPLPFWHARGQFAGVLGLRNERFEATGYSAARVDGANINYFDSSNTLRYRFYADEPMKYGGIDLPAPTPGFTYAWVQSGFASVEHKDILYSQFVSAVTLWDERVAITIGGRNDDLEDDQYGNIGGFNDAHGQQSYGGFVPGLGNRPGAHNLTKAGAFTANYGIVAWADKGQHIGGFFNYSENFAPPTSGAAKIVGFNTDGTVNGAAFGATRGKGSEFGLRFNFLQGLVSGEARYYKNDQIDRIDGGAPVGNFTSIWGSAGPTYANNTLYTQMSFRDVASLQTYGYEFKAVANLKGLRLSANYALPKTKSVDVRPGTRAYFEGFQNIWAKWAADQKNDKGEALTAAEATNINNQILNLQNNIAGTAPGTVNNGTNKWTGSLAATYAFSRESMLRGFSFGYGINGRGQRKVGSVSSAILFGLTAPGSRAATPAENRAAAFAYLYQPAFYTHDINIAYRKRIGKYNYRFQVNVNNLTDKDDLIFGGYVTYRVLGQTSNPLLGMYPSGFNYLDPRKIMLTTSVDF